MSKFKLSKPQVENIKRCLDVVVRETGLNNIHQIFNLLVHFSKPDVILEDGKFSIYELNDEQSKLLSSCFDLVLKTKGINYASGILELIQVLTNPVIEDVEAK